MSNEQILSAIDSGIYQVGFRDGLSKNPQLAYMSHPIYNLAYLDALVYLMDSAENETDLVVE